MNLLTGVRVLDLSRVLAGPYCTALFADLGAEVVKVEPPGGDDARHLGPFKGDASVYFALNNRAKKSLCLDLKAAGGRELLHRLVQRADVVVENFRPGVAQRLGVDYERLSALNPRLIYLSISGFGQIGPLAHRPAYDLIVQAMSGLMSVTGWPDGPPTRVGESLGDLAAGLFGAWAIAVALFARERTGHGQYLDVAMFDSLFALEVTSLARYIATQQAPSRVGNRHPVSTPFDTYRASDGLVVIAVANDALFRRLGELMRRPDLATDERFESDANRTEHEPFVREAIESWTRGQSVAEVCAACEAAGIPVAPIWDVAQAAASDHVRARGLLRTLRHPLFGEMEFPTQPVRFSGTSPDPPRAEPRLGEDSANVLTGWLHLTPEEIAALERTGVIRGSSSPSGAG
jgi:formyl-CoA transferase/CoA:oxalate CoA-transferase